MVVSGFFLLSAAFFFFTGRLSGTFVSFLVSFLSIVNFSDPITSFHRIFTPLFSA